MNVQDFTYLLQHPEKVSSNEQTQQLEDVLNEYPYFQAARALHLKGLKNGNSFKYNNALKLTAAYTTDRDVLFDFITSKEFLQNGIAEAIQNENEHANSEQVAEEPTQLVKSTDDKVLPQSKEVADYILDPELFKSKDSLIDKKIAEEKEKAEATLELGKPLAFTKNEKHSFGQWLQLTSLKRIDRDPEKENKVARTPSESSAAGLEEDVLKKKKFKLIDKFLDENPKIEPQENTAKVDIKSSLEFDKNELMTETLAKVYLEQKKYKKAVQAYKILSLKYPEKSGFFADRIRAVEKIQKENSEE
ncbi:hypothetical protein [Maribacter halichondriae]|uniref:hypothetical protein n=1 Tax=Maribacter halichondriae TaxID=2980554 RepID=UPI002359C16D|nr:hypothetical protein [Maribacter sp. Hal144]